MDNSIVLNITTLNSPCTDGDILLLHACFKLLTDCIEANKLLELTNWEQNEELMTAKSEITELYSWWKGRSKADPLGTKRQYDEDTEMLIRLIRVREYIWA